MTSFNFQRGGLFGLLAIFILSLVGCRSSRPDLPTSSRPPNVVIIFCDDMAYADIAPFGSKTSTPNLSRMAREGMRFTDFYAAQAVCSASRAALLTGCYPNRLGIRGALPPRAKMGLNPDVRLSRKF